MESRLKPEWSDCRAQAHNHHHALLSPWSELYQCWEPGQVTSIHRLLISLFVSCREQYLIQIVKCMASAEVHTLCKGLQCIWTDIALISWEWSRKLQSIFFVVVVIVVVFDFVFLFAKRLFGVVIFLFSHPRNFLKRIVFHIWFRICSELTSLQESSSAWNLKISNWSRELWVSLSLQDMST